MAASPSAPSPCPDGPALSCLPQPALRAMRAVQQRGSPSGSTDAAFTPIHIHFHPDWQLGGDPVIAQLARSGRYLSQFESGISNGSYSPEPGGQRWQWEHDRFDGAYDGADAAHRPVYGAVDLVPLGHAARIGYGAAPRFGSAYLQLHSGVAARSSFCDPDSFWQPTHIGLWPQMQWHALQCLALPDPLDHYVEAHIHGGLLLARDVSAIVLDPSFAGSAIADAALRTGVALRFHGGYRFTASALAPAAQYRGTDIADALADMLRHADAERTNAPLALTPADLGRAQHSGRYPPQVLKKAWHCMARFGAQRPAPGGDAMVQSA